eukprot:scaffold40014_cov19-Tisochrysis_lutea.AAC.1
MNENRRTSLDRRSSSIHGTVMRRRKGVLFSLLSTGQKERRRERGEGELGAMKPPFVRHGGVSVTAL